MCTSTVEGPYNGQQAHQQQLVPVIHGKGTMDERTRPGSASAVTEVTPCAAADNSMFSHTRHVY